MTYYAAIISKYTGRAVCGRYFDNKAKAWEFAKPTCGYSGSVVTYDDGRIVEIEDRA